MVDEDKLSSVLSEFARTLITDFPIQAILDRLVERIVHVLPISSAGVTLIAAGAAPRYVAASDEHALGFERLQTKFDCGPCVRAYESGESVSIPDLTVDERFPRFAPAAVDDGLRAVFTFPLRHGENRFGALDLYRDTAGDLDPSDMDAAQTLADVAAAYLLNAQSREAARAKSERFLHDSLHDPLTRLPNRLLLQERLEHAADRARRSHASTAVLFVDLDHFKRINDTFGHRVGDDLLVAVAERLSALVRSGDTLARYSGDEFVFLCEDLHGPPDVELLAQRVDKAFIEPFVLNDLELNVTASVGMAAAGPGEDISTLLVVQADMAMYQVKRKGGAGHQLVDVREAFQSTGDITLESDLRDALHQSRLDVAYQPIVRSADGYMTGVEALLRWTDAERGAVPPVLMVQVAEQSGLINEIGAWVLERSCRDRARWAREHPSQSLDLAVNVSARQLTSTGFVATIESVVDATGMDPKALVLEMTETCFIEDNQRVLNVLAELDALGIRVALDDFGTGYSSLNYLCRLPIDVVKIDRSFISEIGSAQVGGTIVSAVTDLAHVLGLGVVAEGVETAHQHAEVRAMGCDAAQGYYYARPMPAAGITDLLGARPMGFLLDPPGFGDRLALRA